MIWVQARCYAKGVSTCMVLHEEREYRHGSVFEYLH